MNDFMSNKKMSKEEIRKFFQEKAASKTAGFDLETERLKKEIEDFKVQWFGKTIGKFLDGEEGKKFIEGNEGRSPDEMMAAIMAHSNIQELFNLAVKKKIDELRGMVV